MSFQVLDSWAVTERRCKNREACMSCCLLWILYRYSAPLIAPVIFQQSGNLWCEDKLHCYGIVIVVNYLRKCISSLPVCCPELWFLICCILTLKPDYLSKHLDVQSADPTFPHNGKQCLKALFWAPSHCQTKHYLYMIFPLCVWWW